MREHHIEISPEACIGCGMCHRDCPADNIALKNKKAVARTQSCITNH